ncbi:MAG: GNAT family N-acetyltransferase [Pseudohongiella sp.]|nr:GNAT family N-acetyltransferase [Pseudohongiella sp.]
MPDSMIIRNAQRSDIAALLSMMKALAVFEGYADKFRVTAPELEKRLFDHRDFDVLVADHYGQACGMLVYYRLPFSYDLKPWVYMKELFVREHMRSAGVGKKLMQSFIAGCKQQGVAKIRFDVLSSNERAQKFYKWLGAEATIEWQLFGIDL